MPPAYELYALHCWLVNYPQHPAFSRNIYAGFADHIRTHSKTTKLEYTICFVPRRTLICERLLEEEGVYGDVTIREYHLDIISLEDDLLSLELENSFREVFVVRFLRFRA